MTCCAIRAWLWLRFAQRSKFRFRNACCVGPLDPGGPTAPGLLLGTIPSSARPASRGPGVTHRLATNLLLSPMPCARITSIWRGSSLICFEWLTQCLIEIDVKIFDVLDANRKAQEIGWAGCIGAFDGCAVFDEAFHAAERRSAFPYAQLSRRRNGCLFA